MRVEVLGCIPLPVSVTSSTAFGPRRGGESQLLHLAFIIAVRSFCIIRPAPPGRGGPVVALPITGPG